MTAADLARKPYARRKCSLGEAVVVEDIVVVDHYPEVLASGLPVFVTAEWAALATDPAKQARWDARVRAIADERRLRAADPKRTAYGHGPSPYQNASTTAPERPGATISAEAV